MSQSAQQALGSAWQRARILPVLFFICPFATAVAPQAMWLVFFLTAAALIVPALPRRDNWLDLLRPNTALTAFLAFGAYALLSTTWAADPTSALQKSALFLAVVLLTFAASSAVRELEGQQLRRASLAFAAGALAGAVFVVCELLTEGAITRFALNSVGVLPSPKRVVIAHNEVTRIKSSAFRNNVAVVLFNFWPALLVLTAIADRTRRLAGTALSAIATALAILLSERLSAQVALLASVLTFPLAMVRRRDFVRALAILLCLGFALILPFGFYAYGFRASSWLPDNSQRVRVVFLGQVAERALEHPWFGVGAESSSTLKQSLNTAELPEGFKLPRNIAHPHNFFLQTWYELGLVGAVLFALAGVLLLLRIPLLPFEIQPFASASFVTLVTAATFAWNMWQTWLVCMAGLVILYLRVAAAATGHEDSCQTPRL